ncbi:MAG: dockerin type I repeat-containing protein [Actinomycetota bacterium]
MRRLTSVVAPLGVLIVTAILGATVIAASISDSQAARQGLDQFQIWADTAIAEADPDEVRVTVSISPGAAEPSAVRAQLGYDTTFLQFVRCEGVTSYVACAETTPGVVVLESVTGSAWTSVSDLVDVFFTTDGLAAGTPITVSVDQGLAASTTELAGQSFNGLIAPLFDGDANCTGSVDVTDALVIAQFAATMREATTTCDAVDRAEQLNVEAADFDGSGSVTIVDALFIAQCAALIANPHCG